jgi:hypothetical protein
MELSLFKTFEQINEAVANAEKINSHFSESFFFAADD